MKLQSFPDLSTIERACLSCRRRAPASRLLLDTSDHDRRLAFYCPKCVALGYALKLSKTRARAAKKATANGWRSWGADS